MPRTPVATPVLQETGVSLAPGQYVLGAAIAGFTEVADAVIAMGVV